MPSFVNLSMLFPAISQGGLDWVLWQAFVIFFQAFVLHVIVWLLGIGAKLRLEPHGGETFDAPSPPRILNESLLFYPLKNRMGLPQNRER